MGKRVDDGVDGKGRVVNLERVVGEGGEGRGKVSIMEGRTVMEGRDGGLVADDDDSGRPAYPSPLPPPEVPCLC